MTNEIKPQAFDLYNFAIRGLAFMATILLSLLFHVDAKAQATLYNDAGLLHTDGASYLYIDGDLLNQDTGKIENDGVIEIKGDLTNASTARMVNGSDNSSTERAYKFTGTGTQVIKGDLADAGNRYIQNLIVDKQTSSTIVRCKQMRM